MICEKCGKEFFEDWRKDPKIRNSTCKFCSRQCANSRVQTEEMNEKRKIKLQKKEIRFCSICNKKLDFRTKNDLCFKCYSKKSSIDEKSKGDLFNNRKNWQSARSCIRKNAYKNYFLINKKEYRCAICGYDKYVEVCHKKSVSDFLEEAKLEEINDIDNLVGLCPNHHWEYDNGLLTL